MKKKLLSILLIGLIFCIFTVQIPFLAISTPLDVGNTNDYGGGGSDWGGGGGSDWGGGWGGSDYSSSGDYDGDGSGFFSLGGIIVFIVIVCIVLLTKKGHHPSQPTETGTDTVQPNDFRPMVVNNNDKIVAAIKQVDPHFSIDKFLGWTKEVFITLQNAWTERDWSKIRPFEKEELFKQHETQLEEYKRLGRINIIERITINQAYLSLYKRDKNYEYLRVYMQVRMGDYIIDENTKAVLKGDPNREYQLTYMLSFMRKTGVKTEAVSNKSTTSCPNCGAPTTVTSAGKCEYCDSIITTGEFDWVLYDLSAVKSGMIIDNQGVVIVDDNQNDEIK